MKLVSSSSTPPASHFNFKFMKDGLENSTRKPWYHKAIQMSRPWKIIAKYKEAPVSKTTFWKSDTTRSASKSIVDNSNVKSKLPKCTSLKIATCFTRVCLCAPVSCSYNGVYRGEVPSRRSNSYPRSNRLQASLPVAEHCRVPNGASRPSVEGRRVFRGKSLMDDVLMRRFVIEEEATLQIRRRNQMEVIRKRSVVRRKKLGRSPLSRMVLAGGQFTDLSIRAEEAERPNPIERTYEVQI